MSDFFKNNWWRLLIILMLIGAAYCIGWMMWMTFVYSCDFETKQVKDSTALGDLRIEKTEYWSGCWKGYWVEEETDTFWRHPDSLGYRLKPFFTHSYTVLKDSLICNKCDSVVYNFFIRDTYQLDVNIVNENGSSDMSSWSYGLIEREYMDTVIAVLDSNERFYHIPHSDSMDVERWLKSNE